MQSLVIKRTIPQIICLFICFALVSCMPEEGQNMVENEGLERYYNNAVVKKSTCLIGQEEFQPKNTEGYIKEKDGSYTISLISYTLTKGFYIDLKVDDLSQLMAEHRLDNDTNRVVFNYTNGQQLTTFESGYCDEPVGTICVHAFDKANMSISGVIVSHICSKEPAYDNSVHHRIECYFNNVKLRDL